LRLALEQSPVGMIVAAHVNLGDMVWLDEGPVAGQELYEQGIEFGERRGAKMGVRWGRMQTMWTMFDLGRWDELLEVGADLVATEPEAGTQISVLARIYREHVLLRRGASDGVTFEEEVLPRALEIGDDQVVVPALKAAALGRLTLDDPAGAVAAVDELVTRMAIHPGTRGWMLDDVTDVCLRAGDVGPLDRLLNGFTPHLTRDRISVVAAEAVRAHLRGDAEIAVERYDEAAAGWAAFPHVLQHGLAAMGAGRCLLQLGRTTESEARLRAARDVFARLGATPLIAEVDGLLERATARSG
jgi:hypothetical protein